MKKMLFVFLLFISALSLNAQLSRHGLVLNGGIGQTETKVDKVGGFWEEYDYTAGLSAGYRLRFKEPARKSIHYDLDVNVGIKFLSAKSFAAHESGYPSISKGKRDDSYVSIGFTGNYSLIKNLYVGLGIEPAYYFNQRLHIAKTNDEIKADNNKFDIPVVAKIAYNLKVVEVGVSGKYGLMNVMETPNLKSGKYREIQFSLFIPF